MKAILDLISAAITGLYVFHMFEGHGTDEPGAMILGGLAACGVVIHLLVCGVHLAKPDDS